jgi:uncharacterized protein YndB with AHSA1/START domain
MLPRMRVVRRINASREAVFRALLDPEAVARWRAPKGMTTIIHEFDPREGGRFRVSLVYDTPAGQGKSSRDRDTYHGRFVRLVQDSEVVEAIEFETDDPALRGPMTVTTALSDAESAPHVDVSVTFDGLPAGVSPADNELGTRMALDQLAALVESGSGTR